jgi:precorrin-6x reductase
VLLLAGTPDAKANAQELANSALAAAATPAGRTTSLPSSPSTDAPAMADVA